MGPVQGWCWFQQSSRQRQPPAGPVPGPANEVPPRSPQVGQDFEAYRAPPTAAKAMARAGWAAACSFGRDGWQFLTWPPGFLQQAAGL